MSSLDTLVDQYINYLLLEKGLSQKTLEAYSSDLRRYIDFFKDKGVNIASENDTSLILEHLMGLKADGLGANSRSRHLVAIRGFYKFLTHDKHIKHDPAKLIDLPKKGLKLPNFLSVNEVKKLLDTPDIKNPLGLRNAAMIELSYAAGLRVTELINLKVHDVNLEACFVRVFGKGSKERVVPIGMHARNIIDLYIKTATTRFIEKPYQQVSLCRPERKTNDPAGILETFKKIRSSGRNHARYSPSQLTPLLCQSSS